jgi:hypothetical protein
MVVLSFQKSLDVVAKFLHRFESRGEIDLSYDLSKECLWYCFSGLLQNDIDKVKEHWNTHRIRRSRYNTVLGRPDSLFYFPEYHGGVGNVLVQVPLQEITHMMKLSKLITITSTKSTSSIPGMLLAFHLYLQVIAKKHMHHTID